MYQICTTFNMAEPSKNQGVGRIYEVAIVIISKKKLSRSITPLARRPGDFQSYYADSLCRRGGWGQGWAQKGVRGMWEGVKKCPAYEKPPGFCKINQKVKRKIRAYENK